MEAIYFDDLLKVLGDLGLRAGDVAVVHSRLYAIGRMNGTDVRDLPGRYLEALQETVGEDGTIVVPTYTTAVARYGRRFVLEDTPSEMGVLSEHVRRQPTARRVLHPVLSLTALGRDASGLVDNHPRSNVGHDTIWHRMLQRRGKVVTIGIDPRRCMSFIHHAEYVACVPYLYNKIIRAETFVGGRQLSVDFLQAVRYLEYDIDWDLSRLCDALERKGAMQRRELGGGAVWAASLEDVFEAVMAGIRETPYYLLARTPSFLEGSPPLDGITAPREREIPRYILTD